LFCFSNFDCIKMKVVGAFVPLAVVAADTIASCGADTDHFVISSVSTDADATGGPKKGQPFTITVEGDLDEAHQHGRLFGDLEIKALGVVDTPVSFDLKYDFLPGVAQGPAKLQIGPFTFPKSIPGKVDVTGKVSVVNEREEAVTCLDLNLIIPTILADEEALESEQSGCGDASADHITNIQSVTDDNDITTTTMDLDEEVDYINLKVDLSFKPLLLPAVNLKLAEVPISISPAFQAGQLTFVGYPDEAPASDSNGLLTVTGSLGFQDKNGEELTCIGFGASSTAISV